jgi:hypothetical protein
MEFMSLLHSINVRRRFLPARRYTWRWIGVSSRNQTIKKRKHMWLGKKCSKLTRDNGDGPFDVFQRTFRVPFHQRSRDGEKFRLKRCNGGRNPASRGERVWGIAK